MCGVIGLIGTQNAAHEAFLSLVTLQHRGQDAAGIMSYSPAGFHQVKNLGLVESVFTKDNIQHLKGEMAVGHNRYSTVGTGDISDVQPLVMNYPFGIGMVHNGNIVNHGSLGEQLRSQSRRHLLTQSDTEVLLNLFAEGLTSSSSVHKPGLDFEQICYALQPLYSAVNGSFSVVTLIAGHGLVAFRDSNGLRPLVWGKKKSDVLPSGEAHMVASESVALNINGYEVVRSLKPGEVLFIDLEGNVHSRVIRAKEKRHCMFEWVYFASPESDIDDKPVYRTRFNLGKSLALQLKGEFKDRNIKPDMVVPVPESSRIAAIALSEELEIPYRELLIKNRYIKRTFILDTQDKRRRAVKLKLSPVPSELAGKKVLLIDDSIVRGTTSKKIIELVREAGAKEVYFVSTCPPVRHPCFYGVDFPDRKELVANEKNEKEIESHLGADAVIHQKPQGLVQSILNSQESSEENWTPCMACLDGKYPSDVSEGQGFSEKRKKDRKVQQSEG